MPHFPPNGPPPPHSRPLPGLLLSAVCPRAMHICVEVHWLISPPTQVFSMRADQCTSCKGALSPPSSRNSHTLLTQEHTSLSGTWPCLRNAHFQPMPIHSRAATHTNLLMSFSAQFLESGNREGKKLAKWEACSQWVAAATWRVQTEKHTGGPRWLQVWPQASGENLSHSAADPKGTVRAGLSEQGFLWKLSFQDEGEHFYLFKINL